MADSTSPRRLLNSFPRELIPLLFFGGVLRLWLSHSTGGFDVRCWFDAVKILSSSNFFEFYGLAYPKPAEYEYPPIWMLLLRLVTIGYRLGWYDSELSPAFRFLVKLPIVVCDILVGLVIFLQVRKWTSDERRALLSSMIWLFNPFVIYVSSIQGMFDSICVLFLLLAVHALERDRFLWGGVWFGLALLTKQYAYLTIIPLLAVLIRRRIYRGTIIFFTTSALLFTSFSLPFLIVTPSEYFASITIASRLETSLSTRYQHFTGFFFTGIWYLIDKTFHIPSESFYFYKPAIIISMLVFIVLCYLYGKRSTALSDALLGSTMVFTLVGLMINSQYLVFPMAFSTLDIGIHGRGYAWFIPEIILSTYFPLREIDFKPIGLKTYGLLVSVTMVGWSLTHLVGVWLKPALVSLRSLRVGQSGSNIRKEGN